MPCSDGNYFGRTEYIDNPQLKKEIDVLTRRLCHACKLLAENNVALPKELEEWWYEHRLEDEARTAESKRRAEQQTAKKRRAEYLASVKERVLGQLTEDEREALGLSR